MKNSNMYLGRRWYGISRKWFDNDSRMVRERVGNESGKSRNSLCSVVSRFSLASLICLCMLILGVENVWGATATATLAQSDIKSTSPSDGATGYASYSINSGGKTWNAYAIKCQHSNATSDYHYLQIKKYASNT